MSFVAKLMQALGVRQSLGDTPLLQTRRASLCSVRTVFLGGTLPLDEICMGVTCTCNVTRMRMNSEETGNT